MQEWSIIRPRPAQLLPAPVPISQYAQAYVAQGYGWLIHWNMYTFSQTHSANQPINTFAPTTNNFIDQWVSVAQTAGAKYVGLTAKHEDGFCIWNTASTNYNVTQTSWYQTGGGFDVVGQFCSKMIAGGINPVLYFSLIDNTYSGGFSGSSLTFLQYAEQQLTELLSNYGPITAIWTDGNYGTTPTPFSHNADRNTFIRGLQYPCLDVPNRHVYNKGLQGDILVYESPSSAPNRSPSVSGATLTGGAVGVAATGFVDIGGGSATGDGNLPYPGDTISLGGSVVTFVWSEATGNQCNIGADVATTMTNLSTLCNASSDPNISLCTYSVSNTTRLNATYGVTGTAGNSFTLGVNITQPPSEWAMTDFSPDTLWFWHAGYALKTAGTLSGDMTVAHNRNATFTVGVGPDQSGFIPSDQVTLLESI